MENSNEKERKKRNIMTRVQVAKLVAWVQDHKTDYERHGPASRDLAIKAAEELGFPIPLQASYHTALELGFERVQKVKTPKAVNAMARIEFLERALLLVLNDLGELRSGLGYETDEIKSLRDVLKNRDENS